MSIFVPRNPKEPIMLCVLRVVRALSYGLVAFALTLGPAENRGEQPSDQACLKTYAKVAAALGIEPDTAEARIRTTGRPAAPWIPLMKPVQIVRTNTLQVKLEEQTGQVLYVSNTAVSLRIHARKQLLFESRGKLFMPTRHPSAIVSAVEQFFARVAGHPVPNDLRLRMIEFDPKRGVWVLGWARYIAGYLSDDEGLGASVDDVSGKINHYTYTVTGATCRPVIRLSLKEAAPSARKHAEYLVQKQARGEPYDVLETEPPSLQIVYPNYARTEDAEQLTEEDLRKAAKNPRLAFVFQFEFQYAGNKKSHTILPLAIVWIDAANGDVLGGL